MNDLAASGSRWSEACSALRRVVSMPQGALPAAESRPPRAFRKSADAARERDSFERTRWWLDNRPETPKAIKVYAPCEVAFRYLSATTRQARDVLLRDFVERGLFARLPPESGLRRLSLRFASLNLPERDHLEETGDVKLARICLNLGYLLVPFGDLRFEDNSERWAKEVGSLDARLATVAAELSLARRRMQRERPYDSLLHFEAAVNLVAEMHRKGEDTFKRYVGTHRFSETYRVFFASEGLGLRAHCHNLLCRDGHPSDHSSQMALGILESLAQWYALPLDETPPASLRPSLRRTLTSSSAASRTLGSIAEEVSMFSDDEESSEEGGGNDTCHQSDAFEYDRPASIDAPSPLFLEPPEADTHQKLAPAHASGDPTSLEADARSVSQAKELSMRWGSIFHPGREWETDKSRSQQATAGRSSMSLDRTSQEARRMTSPTRGTDVSTTPRGDVSSSRQATQSRQATDYGSTRVPLSQSGPFYEPDNFGGYQPIASGTTPARSQEPMPHTPSMSYQGFVPTGSSPNDPTPAKQSMAQRMAQEALEHRDSTQNDSYVGRFATQPPADSQGDSASVESGYTEDLDRAILALQTNFGVAPEGPSQPTDASPGRANRGGKLDTTSLHRGAAPASAAVAFEPGEMPTNVPAAKGKGREAQGVAPLSPSKKTTSSKAMPPFGSGEFPNNVKESAPPANATRSPNAKGSSVTFSNEPQTDNALSHKSAAAGRTAAPAAPARASSAKLAVGPQASATAKPIASSKDPSMPGALPNQAASVVFGEGGMEDNEKLAQAHAVVFGAGGMEDNEKLTVLASLFGDGAMPDNAKAARIADLVFGSDGMPDNEKLALIGRVFGVGGMLDNGPAPTTRPATAGRIAATTSRAAQTSAPAAHRQSLYSSGLMVPSVQRSAAPSTTAAPRTSAAPSEAPSRSSRAMPYSWQSVFAKQPAVIASIEQVGANTALDRCAQALTRADYQTALVASREAHDALTRKAGNTTLAARIMSDMYRAYLTGPLPDALAYRLRDTFTRGDMQALHPLVDFVQYVNRTVVSTYALDARWQQLSPYRFWQADWPWLGGYQALSTTIGTIATLHPNYGGPSEVAVRHARNAIRTQMLLQGPTQPYEIERGEVYSHVNDVTTTNAAQSSLFAALDADLYNAGDVADGPFTITVTSPTYVRLQADNRDTLEQYFREVTYFLELLVQGVAAGQSVRADDVAMLARIHQTVSVERACDQLQAYLSERTPDVA